MKVDAIKFNPMLFSSSVPCQPLRPELKQNGTADKLDVMSSDNIKLVETLGNKLNILA